MKTVVITGGSGFIGSHFVRMLLGRTDWRVVNLDALTYAGDPARLGGLTEGPCYRFVRGDIADAQLVSGLFAEEMPWAAVNFAAESHVDRSIMDSTPFLRTNVAGVQTLLEAVRRHRVSRLVQISTDEVYGDLQPEERASETSSLRPSSPYAASKAAADLLCLSYRRTHRVPVMVVRSSNNYGPWQHPEKLIPLMIHHALTGEPLPVYGDGAQQRDWLFVEDNCEAILRVLVRGEDGAVYNVATGIETTNIQIVRELCRTLADEGVAPLEALEARIRSVPDRPGHDRKYAMSALKTRCDLEWVPQTAYGDGLRRTVRWYLRHREWLERAASDDYRDYCGAVYTRQWGTRPA
jgi:dTDP-glucose 4,6-dehydratase